MFNIFSKSKKEKVDFGVLKADMHSHLLPGIDDGSPDMQTSLQLIRGMADLGYKKLVTTPHIMWDMYKNTPTIINENLALLKEAVAAEGMEIELAAAAEYYIDEYFEDLLKRKEPLLAIGGNMVLVEFSMAQPPLDLKDVLFEMQMQGYQPVIAHPERYIYLEKNKDFYTELFDAGYYFQCNILALTGGYGKAPKELAQWLAKNEYYHFLGTDLHHFRHLDGLFNPEIMIPVKRLLDSGKMKNTEL
jgi:protein-tyrosine phosphatase